MKRFFKTAFTLAFALAAIFGGYSYIEERCLPDTVSVYAGEDFSYGRGLLTARANERAVTPASAGENDSYGATLYLFDLIPLKHTMVNVVERVSLEPGGTPFGVKLFTEGVVVIGFGEVATAKGSRCPAREAGIEEGDVVITVDGKRVTGNADLSAIVSSSEGGRLEIVLTRNEERKTVYVSPANAKDGTGFKIGMWVRDSSAGIGTLTYYNPETEIVAGLGHGVTDADTEIVLPVQRGELVAVSVTGVEKGQVGAPGELKGAFHNESPFASLRYNCPAGVFGRVIGERSAEALLPIALKQEVQRGEASILCTVEGDTPAYYSAEILSVNLSENAVTQNIIIKITDRALLDKTGGIVQGMSGSPIIQNGKIVGAVTHVFLNDPTKGYGIFIENMLSCEREFA